MSTAVSDQDKPLSVVPSGLFDHVFDPREVDSAFPFVGANPVLDSTHTPNEILPYFLVRAGNGFVTRESCGSFIRAIACVNGDEFHREDSTEYHFRHCKDLRCPVCFEFEKSRRAKLIVERISQVQVLWWKEGMDPGDFKHWSLSFDKDLFPLEFFSKDGCREAYALAEWILSGWSKDGHFGGVLIPHPWRRKHEDGFECRRGKECKEKHHWEFGFHFHCLLVGFLDPKDRFAERSVFGPRDPKTDQFKQVFVLHRIEEKDGRERDLYQTLAYEMSHQGIFVNPSTGHASKGYRWVGCFKERLTYVVNKRKEYRPVACYCKANKHEFKPKFDGARVVFDESYEIDCGEFLEAVAVIIYDFRRAEDGSVKAWPVGPGHHPRRLGQDG